MILPFNSANVSVAAALAFFALFLWIVAPYGALDCDDPVWRSEGPGGERLSACPRLRLVGMPGQGSDAPAFLVLRDRAGWIRGVASITMIQTLQDRQAEWRGGAATVSLHADFDAPPWRPAPLAFFVEAQWRVRAYLGLIPSDRDFR